MYDDELLTTKEVLAYLRVTHKTIYRLVKAGRIPCAQIGRHWRFRRSEIDAWLATGGTKTVRPERTLAESGVMSEGTVVRMRKTAVRRV